VIGTWGVTIGVDYVSPERIHQLESMFYEKIRQKTVSGKHEVLIIIKNLNIMK
jgi:hypothetical protein